MSIETEELAAEVLASAAEWHAASGELRQLGINPSPADTEAWLAMTPRQRDKAAMSWTIYRARWLFDIPAQNHYQEFANG
jgi:hypothetical protein